MNIVFFILLFIIILLIIPVKLNLKLSTNILKNRGYIKLKVFNIKILYYKIKYKDKKIVLNNYKTKKEIDIDINMENIDFINELQKEIRKRLYLKNLKIYVNFGVKDEPSITALTSSFIEIILSTFSSLIKFQKPTSKINYQINAFNTKDIVVFDIDLTLSLSITNLILSLIKTKKNITKKENLKNGREKRKTSNRRCDNTYIEKY